MHQHLKIALRRFLAAGSIAIVAAGAMLTDAQAQQPYPSKPIKLLVGVPPGGSTDAITRMFAEWLQESTGQPAVVDNRPGANTSVAADVVAHSAPDGYTLLVATDAFITMPLLTKTSWDPYKDFVPIGIIALNRFVLAVHPSVPVNSVKELIAYAKARPRKINFDPPATQALRISALRSSSCLRERISCTSRTGARGRLSPTPSEDSTSCRCGRLWQSQRMSKPASSNPWP